MSEELCGHLDDKDFQLFRNECSECLRAENAALTERVKELEIDCLDAERQCDKAEAKVLSLTKDREVCESQYLKLGMEKQALTAKLARMEAVVEAAHLLRIEFPTGTMWTKYQIKLADALRDLNLAALSRLTDAPEKPNSFDEASAGVWDSDGNWKPAPEKKPCWECNDTGKRRIVGGDCDCCSTPEDEGTPGCRKCHIAQGRCSDCPPSPGKGDGV